MRSLFQDLRFSFRVLLKQPGFTLVAVLTLALGIGLNSSFFSIVNAILLKPINLPEPDRTVAIWETVLSQGVDHNETAPANFFDWRAQNSSFEQVALYTWWTVNLTGVEPPERLRGFRATANLFDTLGIKPALGRSFTREEEQPGKDSVVILTHGLWQRRFGGDPQIIGKTITLSGLSRTVVGVLPADQDFPRGGEVIAPLANTPQLVNNREMHGYLTVARLKTGVSVEQAQADLSAVAGRLAKQYPQSNTGRDVVVKTVLEDTVRNYKKLLPAFMGAAFFVLLIACANVANLLLARAAARGREISVRLALGASRRRIIQQLLTESIVLALIGGALGVVVALWGVELLKASLPDDAPQMMPGFDRLGLNWSVLGYMGLISIFAGLLFGLAPAWQASKPNLNEMLKDGVGRTTGVSGRSRLRSSFVVVQVALSLVLLIGAGLLMKSFLNLLKADPGFNPENVMTMSLTLPAAKYKEPKQRADFYEQLTQRISALPGIEAVGLINYLPLGQSNSSNSFLVEGQPEPPPGQKFSGRYRVCTPQYFQALRIGLKKGRPFTERDRADSPPVIIINEKLANRFWPNGDALGKRIRFTGPIESNPWMEVVGVVGDVRHEMNLPITSDYYLPHAQDPWSTMSLVARAQTSPTSLVGAIRQALQSIDPDQPVAEIRTMTEVRDRSIMHFRFLSGVMGIFGFFALTLAAVGIYGVMSYAVSQRTHEIGVRMALGAQTPDVINLVMKQGLGLIFIGVTLGLLASFGLTRVMAGALYEVNATDWMTFGIVTLVLAAVALLACWLPAHRATKVDPVTALRTE